jgi:hypothetical protein
MVEKSTEKGKRKSQNKLKPLKEVIGGDLI